MRMAIVAVVVVVGGCQSALQALRQNTNRPAPPAPVRPADLEAWQGAPVMELETHPYFSIEPRKVTPLSDGGQLWNYTTCAGADVCCHSQFLVAGPVVKAYRAVGHCFTDCTSRPASRPCTQAELVADREAAERRAASATVAGTPRSRTTTQCHPDAAGGIRCDSE